MAGRSARSSRARRVDISHPARAAPGQTKALAAATGVSRATLPRHFKPALGQTPRCLRRTMAHGPRLSPAPRYRRTNRVPRPTPPVDDTSTLRARNTSATRCPTESTGRSRAAARLYRVSVRPRPRPFCECQRTKPRPGPSWVSSAALYRLLRDRYRVIRSPCPTWGNRDTRQGPH